MTITVIELIILILSSAVASLVSARALGRSQQWNKQELESFSLLSPVLSTFGTGISAIAFLDSAPLEMSMTSTLFCLALIGLAGAIAPAGAVLLGQFGSKCFSGICRIVDHVVP